jgi:trigger factor
VFPHVELAPFSAFSIRRPHAAIDDADIDRMVGTLREQRKTFRDVERAAVDGDQVTIDFKGYRDGELFEGGSGEGVSFILGQNQMIADFETGVRGQAAGATLSFDAKFPDDYRVESLRGQTVRFDVDVKAVAEPQLPELDEAFFKSFGVDEGGSEAFRAEVRANMERELDTAVRNQVKRQVMDEIDRHHTVQLPATMVAREIGELRHQMAHQMGLHDHKHDHDHDHRQDMPDLPDEFFRAQAERRVKIGLVVNQVIAARNVTTDAGRVRARIEEMARPYAQPEQVVNWYYNNEAQLSQVQMSVLEEQVVELILADATVTDIDSNYQDVIAGRAIGAAAADAAGESA